MILITDEQRAALRANAELPGTDPCPVAKLFNPVGPATWLATELDADGDTLFGLADLGFGSPELGSFSLLEISRLRLPFGLGIKSDRLFATSFPLSIWVDQARISGSIIAAETVLAASARANPAPELPPDF